MAQLAPSPSENARWYIRSQWLRLNRALVLCVTVGLFGLLGGCASGRVWWGDTVGYYWQSSVGHLTLMMQAERIETLLQDPDLTQPLRQQLLLAQRLRTYASKRLLLPDNGSYSSYVQLDREAVVWNVFATPPLSLAVHRWCYPVAGCVGYRGYYDRAQAREYAQRLSAQGLDVAVLPVPAYSTLGWFDDPLLSTFIHRSAFDLANLMFHELAHQKFYLKGDTALNESYATVVASKGVEQWLRERDEPELLARYFKTMNAREQIRALLRETRQSLAQLYDTTQTARLQLEPEGLEGLEDKRAQKRQIIQSFQQRYRQLVMQAFGRIRSQDVWLSSELNNAHFASVGLYDQWVGALSYRFDELGDWASFYETMQRLEQMDPQAREARLLQWKAAYQRRSAKVLSE